MNKHTLLKMENKVHFTEMLNKEFRVTLDLKLETGDMGVTLLIYNNPVLIAYVLYIK